MERLLLTEHPEIWDRPEDYFKLADKILKREAGRSLNTQMRASLCDEIEREIGRRFSTVALVLLEDFSSKPDVPFKIKDFLIFIP